MTNNYKGKLGSLVWDTGDKEVFGKILDHTEVFIFECEWGEISSLDPASPPRDLHMRICGLDQVAYIPTHLLGRKGSMALCAAPAQIRIERPLDLFFCQCDLPCRIETNSLTPVSYEGRCVLLSDTGLVDFVAEPLAMHSSVLAAVPFGMEWLTLPGSVVSVVSTGPTSHKLRVKFDRLDRLTSGRLRSLSLTLT